MSDPSLGSIQHTIPALLSKEIVAEIHNLLWTKPIRSRSPTEAAEAGWSCRDHAFVVGFILYAAGIESDFVTGKNMFVRGPALNKPPMGYVTNVRTSVTRMCQDIGYL